MVLTYLNLHRVIEIDSYYPIWTSLYYKLVVLLRVNGFFLKHLEQGLYSISFIMYLESQFIFTIQQCAMKKEKHHLLNISECFIVY
jgi:hypothetical protein